MAEIPRLWIVISRPDRLPGAIVAAQALREKFTGGVHLLREHTKWWERADWELYASQFAQVHAFRRVETCRGVRDLPRLYRESIERRRALAELPINARSDLLLCLGGVLKIANVAVSAHKEVKKILTLSDKTYRALIRPTDRKHFRYTTASWFQNRLIEPMAGINRTQRFKPRINPGGDGVRFERMQNDPRDIYDRVIVLSNTGAALQGEAGDQVMAARFPSIAHLRDLPTSTEELAGTRKVIFFGTPFLFIHNLAPSIYIEHLNGCLDFIRRNHPGCQLVYRPHPVETNESKKLQLDDFTIEDDKEAAELYFLRNYPAIEAVYSVSSTVSRTALNNGLNGYAFYSLFPFTKQQTEFFVQIMGQVPLEFAIRDLSAAPRKYQPLTSQGGLGFAEALARAVESVNGSTPIGSAG